MTATALQIILIAASDDATRCSTKIIPATKWLSACCPPQPTPQSRARAVAAVCHYRPPWRLFMGPFAGRRWRAARTACLIRHPTPIQQHLAGAERRRRRQQSAACTAPGTCWLCLEVPKQAAAHELCTPNRAAVWVRVRRARRTGPSKKSCAGQSRSRRARLRSWPSCCRRPARPAPVLQSNQHRAPQRQPLPDMKGAVHATAC